MLRDRAQLTVRSVRYPGVPVCGLRAARGAGIRRMHRSLVSRLHSPAPIAHAIAHVCGTAAVSTHKKSWK